MAQTPPYKICFVAKSRKEEEDDEKIYKRYSEILATLPTSTEGWSGKPIYQYQGFWYNSEMAGVGPLMVQDYFKARPSDILVASIPRCGTTWLKSLTFAVMNRKSHPPSAPKNHPLNLFNNSHYLVPVLEMSLYNNFYNGNRVPNLDVLPSPRLFGTHMPYTSLPQSVIHSSSRILYICRNANDNLISWWHLINKLRLRVSLEPMKLEEAFDRFCKGVTSFGPFWEHVLGYWKASLERPQNVLFLKYDEMSADPALHLREIAEFMGCPFSSIEEKEGVVDQIIKLCSFENLSNLAVNTKEKDDDLGIPTTSYFRKGKVGDSANYLSPEMIEQVDRISEQKFQGLGLTL